MVGSLHREEDHLHHRVTGVDPAVRTMATTDLAMQRRSEDIAKNARLISKL